MHNTHARGRASGSHEKRCRERKGSEGKAEGDPHSASVHEGGKGKTKPKKDKNEAKKSPRGERHKGEGQGVMSLTQGWRGKEQEA